MCLCCSGNDVHGGPGVRSDHAHADQNGAGPLGKHRRDTANGHDSSAAASKRMRRSGQHKVQICRPQATGWESKNILVGSRVGIWWKLDKIFYRVCAADTCLQLAMMPVCICAQLCCRDQHADAFVRRPAAMLKP